jgi:mannose-6-phosphate isomerase-like protein (cupin superfamily)
MFYENKYYKYKQKYLAIKNNLTNQIGGKILEKNIKVFHNKLEINSKKNNNFRKVLFTTNNMQLVIMSLLPNENISLEIHKEHDQFIKIEKGKCIAIIGNTEKKIITIEKGDCIIIPANTYHEIKNIGKEKLKLFTIYTPPEHGENRIDKKKPI